MCQPPGSDCTVRAASRREDHQGEADCKEQEPVPPVHPREPEGPEVSHGRLREDH